MAETGASTTENMLPTILLPEAYDPVLLNSGERWPTEIGRLSDMSRNKALGD
jgi:hypothetical protein